MFEHRKLIHDRDGRLLGVVITRAGGFEARDFTGALLRPANYADAPATGRRLTLNYFISAIRAEDAVRQLHREDAVQLSSRPGYLLRQEAP